VATIDPTFKNLDEGIRFPICNLANLKKAFEHAGLCEVAVTKLVVITVFKDFEDFRIPFLSHLQWFFCLKCCRCISSLVMIVGTFLNQILSEPGRI